MSPIDKSSPLPPKPGETSLGFQYARPKLGRVDSLFADADRERELFAKLKQRGLGPGAPPGAREYSGTPTENLPSRPEE